MKYFWIIWMVLLATSAFGETLDEKVERISKGYSKGTLGGGGAGKDCLIKAYSSPAVLTKMAQLIKMDDISENSIHDTSTFDNQGWQLLELTLHFSDGTAIKFDCDGYRSIRK